MTARDVSHWTMERTATHYGPVPVMPRDEREALTRLELARYSGPMPSQDRELHAALWRKLCFRAARERIGVYAC